MGVARFRMSFHEIVSKIKLQLANGNFSFIQGDSAGNAKMTLGTTIAGEDVANDVLKAEQRFSAANIASATTSQVKTGTGLLHNITINNAGTSWEIDIYDGTSSSGTSLGKIRGATLPNSLRFDTTFSSGLFVDAVKGSTAGDITISYR